MCKGGLSMKYTKEQRLNIGKQIYEGKLTKHAASVQYGIGIDTAREYMRLYRDTNNLSPKNKSLNNITFSKGSVASSKFDLSDYEIMSKEELIKELVKSKVNELRLKKGYTVEGVGADKVFIPLNNKNIK